MSKHKDKWELNILMTKSEQEEFVKAFKCSTCRTMSSYARKLLLGDPVTVMYRNRSLDDFIESAVQLRKELKLVVSKDSLANSEKAELRRKLARIEENLIKIVEQCSQK
jgi:16S rRNA U1498 N3-methylase RsmE